MVKTLRYYLAERNFSQLSDQHISLIYFAILISGYQSLSISPFTHLPLQSFYSPPSLNNPRIYCIPLSLPLAISMSFNLLSQSVIFDHTPT